MNPPRICILVTSAMTATTFLRGYLAFLRDSGWEVMLVCAPGDGIEELARHEGVVVHQVNMRRDPSPLHDLVSLMRIVHLLQRARPDVLVYATPKASLLGAIAGRIVRVRTRVYEQWGLRLETGKGMSYRILTLLEKVTARCSTNIVANSASLASTIQQLGVNAGRPVDVLGCGSSHGVDVDHFNPSEQKGRNVDVETANFLEVAPGMLTVGFVGRLHPDKGIDTLLEALSICADNGTPVRAVLVGSEEGATLDDHLAALSGRVPVRLVGPKKDVRPYLQAVDVLVLMSRREGFPNVVLEAASMATPAIVADSTGTIDSVIDGITGLVVGTENAKSLAQVLTELDSDRQRIRLMGKDARQHVIDNYSQRDVWRLHSEYFKQARAMGSAKVRSHD